MSDQITKSEQLKTTSTDAEVVIRCIVYLRGETIETAMRAGNNLSDSIDELARAYEAVEKL